MAASIYLVEGRKIALDVGELFSKLRIGGNFVPASLTLEVVERIPAIPLSEIHGRIIVATAQALKARVLTRGERITDSGIVETIWKQI